MKSSSVSLFRLVFSFEFLFVLFLTSGIYKSHPHLSWIPLDLTVLFVIVGVIIAFYLWLLNEWSLNTIGLLFTLLYVLFVLYVFVSMAWSPSSNYATHKMVRLVTVVPWAFLPILFIIGQSKVRLNRFFNSILLISMVFIIVLFYTFVHSGGRFVVEWANYLLITRFVGMGSLILIYWLTQVKTPLSQYVLLTLLGVHAIAILLSGSRGAGLALFFGILTFILLNIEFGNIIRVYSAAKTLIATGLLGLILMVISFPYFGEQIPSVSRALRIFSSDQTDGSLSSRLEFYSSAYQMWLESPFIGQGIGGFAPLHTGTDGVAYPHNIFLEIIAELGLVGLVLFSLIAAVSFLRIIGCKTNDINQERNLLISVATFWLIGALLSFDLTGNRYLFMSFALLCVSYDILVPNEQL